MTNNLYVVGKRQNSLSGKTFRNVQGFDYEDEATGLTLNVRDGSPNLRIFGKIIDIPDLQKFVNEKGRKHP